MPARLILHADDFGLTPGINRGILQLFQAGVLSSASLMSTAPAAAEAIAMAREHPGLGVGCHVTFVDGVPAAHPESIPTLLGADGKTFRPSLLDFTQAVLRRTVRASDLAIETQAQIQRLQRAGIDVTHVDTHKHVHVLPGIANTMLHIAQRCGVHAVRNPFEPAWSAAMCRATLVRRSQLHLLRRYQAGFNARACFQSGEMQTTDGTLGIAATGLLDADLLRRMLGRALVTSGTAGDAVWELCLHPGYPDLALTQVQTRLRTSRRRELEALLCVVPEIFQSPSAPELIHYGDLGVAGLQRASGQFLPNTGFERVV